MAELSTYDFDSHLQGWATIDRLDVFAWVWDAWNASARGVARATFPDDDLEERVAEIAEFFRTHRRTARWHVGRSTRSRKLVTLLQERAGAVQEPRDERSTGRFALPSRERHGSGNTDAGRSARLARALFQRSDAGDARRRDRPMDAPSRRADAARRGSGRVLGRRTRRQRELA
jgi:hypothetical protein